MRLAGHVAVIRNRINTYKIFGRKVEAKRSLQNKYLLRRKIINDPESNIMGDCGLD
jgi:hypothetical protein